MDIEIAAPSGITKKHRIEPPTKTFFFERPDGSVFWVKEEEANDLIRRRPQVLGVDTVRPKHIGTSDGQKFYNAVIEAHALHDQGKVDEAFARLKQGEKEELEAARGNLEAPRNFDSIDQNRRPIQLSSRIR